MVKVIMRTHIALALLLVGVAVPASAQQADARWTPWLGCWQMLDERVRDNNPSGADAVAAARARVIRGTTDVSVCVTPASQPNAVTLRTRASDEPAFEQTIAADAVAHPITEGGCTGSQRAEWSADGYRLFAHAELTCANQPARKISGLTMMATNGTWLDVQAIDVGGATNVRVRRYRRTSTNAGVGSATAVAHAALAIEDVKEASTKVASPALEAALIESGASFRLDRRVLVDLDDARVPDAVIDLMVALSYPERFQVERRIETSADSFPPSYAGADWSGIWGVGYPYFSMYPNYLGNYRYYYSPFGYGYAGLYDPYSPYYYYPGSVVVGGGAAPPPAANAADGRVVNGVGYTRIRPREAVPSESGGSSSGARSSGRSSDGGGSVSTSGYSQSGGGSSDSGGGSSSGGGGSSSSGSGGDGGRTAQPR
jgi:hypothetical protein